MKKENGLATFFRTTYQTGSPIPYIISIQIGVFILIHIADLFVELEIIQFPLYDWMVQYLGLPNNLSDYVRQPWSILTYPFLYTELFNIVFDCLWLYWMGNTFLNFLSKKQFLTVYFSAFILSGFTYVLVGNTGMLNIGPQSSLITNAMGLAALISSLLLLTPKMELRLFLFGTVRFKTIAIVYYILQLGFFYFANRPAVVAYVIAIGWGLLFTHQLKEGRDISRFFQLKRKTKLRVVHPASQPPTYRSHKSDLPNQEIVDEILDKISLSGYESLSSHEKEILFRASREEQK
ncbi:MAG TPA: rhomboid family intramembrane serine protease [Candidatus Sphingobacterium stercorigallinarum]|nr:rhomboid family intramembrane serine protease [Candidatus Sphingobacterium stercorigallinarum]